MNTTTEKTGKSTYYQLFRVSIWIKAISSVGEIIAGILITFIPSSFIVSTSLLLTQGDVDGDKDDFLAHLILSAAHSFSLSNDLLIGIYIFARGLVQFIIVIALFRNKRWAYPALIAVLVLIICIQTYEIIFSHSLAAAILTVIDVVTLLLVINEYRTVRKA